MGQEKLRLFGEYALDTARGCLLCAGRPVHLRPQAYRALKFLTENRGVMRQEPNVGGNYGTGSFLC